jgi:tyrosyl-tRNA synthetase
MGMGIWRELQERGLVQDCSGDKVGDLLEAGQGVVYLGIDPTAPSLQVGNLVGLTLLARLARAGNSVIVLIGGGTALVGDPGGKEEERALVEEDTIAANSLRIRDQVERLLARAGVVADIKDNRAWLGGLELVDFLRRVGKLVSVNQMMAKESVRRRLEGGSFLSFAEFSYMLLQAYDFFVLNRDVGCNLQCGGSDQWGNITMGIELTRRLAGREVYGFTTPLLTRSDGQKFGKTEKGSIWLSEDLTSPLSFYQFWLRLPDDLGLTALRRLSLRPLEEVREIEAAARAEPARRPAQRALAEEMTAFVHGEAALLEAREASERLYDKPARELTERDIEEIASEAPPLVLSRSLLAEGVRLVEVAAMAGVCSSISEARRLARQGGLYLNDERVGDEDRRITSADLISGDWVILRAGRRRRALVRFRS